MSEKLDDLRNGYFPIGVFPEGTDFDGNPLGKERFVRYDLNAFAEMERIYGSMDEANLAMSKGSMADVRRILWIGLIHDQAELDEITGEPIRYKLTMYEVGKWLTVENMRSVMDKLNLAISGSVPPDSIAGEEKSGVPGLSVVEDSPEIKDIPAKLNFETKPAVNDPNVGSQPEQAGIGPSIIT